jgi:hypothetical protein
VRIANYGWSSSPTTIGTSSWGCHSWWHSDDRAAASHAKIGSRRLFRHSW